MTEETNGLDSFLGPETSETPAQPENSVQLAPQEDVNLEDEFAKLLNDFIAQDSNNGANAPQAQPPAEPVRQTPPVQPQELSLDGFVSSPEAAAPTFAPAPIEPVQEQGFDLDSFIDTSNDANSLDSLDSYTTSDNSSSEDNAGGLDGFVTTEEYSSSESGLDGFVDENTGGSSLDGMISSSPNEEAESGLKSEEQELARAISNFKDGVTVMANSKSLKMPTTDYEESMLSPNYKPSIGKKIAQYLLDCWDIINKYDPEDMKRLSPNASDEEYLSFAENLSDTYMQLAIISYVEILINLEICEVSYEQKKEAMMKNRIKRELYEEYMELQERKNMFIKKLKEKNFPIDVDKLMNNYFRAAQKDAIGAFDALTKNPAMFSRIEVEKLHPRFFGLIKVTPEDGIKANQKIGSFIKKLKV